MKLARHWQDYIQLFYPSLGGIYRLKDKFGVRYHFTFEDPNLILKYNAEKLANGEFPSFPILLLDLKSGSKENMNITLKKDATVSSGYGYVSFGPLDFGPSFLLCLYNDCRNVREKPGLFFTDYKSKFRVEGLRLLTSFSGYGTVVLLTVIENQKDVVFYILDFIYRRLIKISVLLYRCFITRSLYSARDLNGDRYFIFFFVSSLFADDATVVILELDIKQNKIFAWKTCEITILSGGVSYGSGFLALNDDRFCVLDYETKSIFVSERIDGNSNMFFRNFFPWIGGFSVGPIYFSSLKDVSEICVLEQKGGYSCSLAPLFALRLTPSFSIVSNQLLASTEGRIVLVDVPGCVKFPELHLKESCVSPFNLIDMGFEIKTWEKQERLYDELEIR